MDALDLIQLGRRLTSVGRSVLAESKSPSSRLPAGARVVLKSALANPGSSVSEIAARTGLPQSYASESIAHLRNDGLVVTRVDPADRRRTLVHPNRRPARGVARAGSVSADAALHRLLDETGLRDSDRIVEVLNRVATRLVSAERRPASGALPTGRHLLD